MNKDYLVKLAFDHTNPDIGYGDSVGNAIGATVGRINNYLNPASAFQLMVLSPRMILNPTESSKGTYRIDEKDRKAKMYKKLMAAMLKENPNQLNDVRVNLGGPRYIHDIRRALTNSRTFPLLRPLYALTTPVTDFVTNIARSDHYNPLNNTVTLYSDNPAIMSHELGHAIDINSWGLGGARDKEKESKQKVLRRAFTKLMRHIKNLPRDAYSVGKGIFSNPASEYFNPVLGKGLTLWQEAMANTRSFLNIRKALKKNPEALKNLYILRNKALPAAYSTYLLGSMDLDPSVAVKGFLRAKLLGEAMNMASGNNKTEYRAYHDFMDAMLGKEKDKETVKDKKEGEPKVDATKSIQLNLSKDEQDELDSLKENYPDFSLEASKGEPTLTDKEKKIIEMYFKARKNFLDKYSKEYNTQMRYPSLVENPAFYFNNGRRNGIRALSRSVDRMDDATWHTFRMNQPEDAEYDKSVQAVNKLISKYLK